MRLDKFLGHQGLGSRKDIRALLKTTPVTVNGVLITNPATHIDEHHDEIAVNGEIIHYAQYHYVMLHKPAGVVSATEDNVHRTVLDLIAEPHLRQGLFPVGRLDIDTEGLLLLTNNGQLAHQLLSPKKHVDKCYEVHTAVPISDMMVQQLTTGVTLADGYHCLPAKVNVSAPCCMQLTIREGKFHQVKRMCLACGNEVVYLKRLAMGPLQLDNQLAVGTYRLLNETEKEALVPYGLI